MKRSHPFYSSEKNINNNKKENLWKIINEYKNKSNKLGIRKLVEPKCKSKNWLMWEDL